MHHKKVFVVCDISEPGVTYNSDNIRNCVVYLESIEINYREKFSIFPNY